jgi:hypothetical protein
MSDPQALVVGRESFVGRHRVFSYFALTYAISWTGALLVVLPHLVRREGVPKLAGILMFPVMLLGPSVAGIALTRLLDGRAGLSELFARMRGISFGLRWYAMLLIPPALVFAVLLCLKIFVSPAYAPNLFLPGIRIWFAGRSFRGNWLDGLCVPENAAVLGSVRVGRVAGCAVGNLAFAGH